MTRRVKTVPATAANFELPAFDVRHLEDNPSARMKEPAHLGEQITWFGNMLHDMKERDDVERAA
jgi:hypothetical protein